MDGIPKRLKQSFQPDSKDIQKLVWLGVFRPLRVLDACTALAVQLKQASISNIKDLGWSTLITFKR